MARVLVPFEHLGRVFDAGDVLDDLDELVRIAPHLFAAADPVPAVPVSPRSTVKEG